MLPTSSMSNRVRKDLVGHICRQLGQSKEKYVLPSLYKKFQNTRLNYSDAKNFIPPSMCTWHVGSRWYTSNPTQSPLTFNAFVPPWHQGVEEISSVCFLEVTTCFTSESAANSLPHRGFYMCLKICKSVTAKSGL
jgi:hypothetical protein